LAGIDFADAIDEQLASMFRGDHPREWRVWMIDGRVPIRELMPEFVSLHCVKRIMTVRDYSMELDLIDKLVS